MICPYCDGNGCSECDETGTRYHAVERLSDGTIISVHGSGEGPSDEAREALRQIAKAAADHLAALGETQRA